MCTVELIVKFVDPGLGPRVGSLHSIRSPISAGRDEWGRGNLY